MKLEAGEKLQRELESLQVSSSEGPDDPCREEKTRPVVVSCERDGDGSETEERTHMSRQNEQQRSEVFEGYDGRRFKGPHERLVSRPGNAIAVVCCCETECEEGRRLYRAGGG